MFKAIIKNDTSISQNVNIPFNVIKDTNNDVIYNSSDNTIVFNRPGYYNVDFHIVTTDVPVGDITISEVLNNSQSSTVYSTETSAAVTDFITIDLPDVLSVNASYIGNNATLSYNSNATCTVSTGYINIYRIGR